MGKALGALVAGVFVGAVGMEIFRRAFPHALDKLAEAPKRLAASTAEAFMDGFRSAGRSAQTAPAPEPGA